MRYLSLALLFFLLTSCKKEDVLLPKSNVTVVKDISDISAVYLFFRTEGKDTLAEVNRNNTISTTNWVFNIDRRLPLRIVIPEIIKLQGKKQKGMHENPSAQNYYSYADSVGKNLAFLPFTNVNYTMQAPKLKVVYFTKSGQWKIGNQFVNKDQLKQYIIENPKAVFGFDKNSSYDSYIQQKVFLAGLKVEQNVEFIY